MKKEYSCFFLRNPNAGQLLQIRDTEYFCQRKNEKNEKEKVPIQKINKIADQHDSWNSKHKKELTNYRRR